MMLQQIEVAVHAQGRVRVRDRPAARLHAVLRGSRRHDAAGPAPVERVASLRRLASVPITLFGLVLVTFLIGRVMPIDPVMAIVGDRAPQDVVERYGRAGPGPAAAGAVPAIYLGNLLHGDLGRSVMTQQPVIADIARFFPGDARAGDRGDPDRRRGRRAAGGFGGGAAGSSDRSYGPGPVPVRPFDAGLRAGRCLRCWCSTRRSAGRRAPGGRTWCSRAWCRR